VRFRTRENAPGAQPLPAGRHGFAMREAAQARGKTVAEAACGFSVLGGALSCEMKRTEMHRGLELLKDKTKTAK